MLTFRRRRHKAELKPMLVGQFCAGLRSKRSARRLLPFISPAFRVQFPHVWRTGFMIVNFPMSRSTDIHRRQIRQAAS